MDNTDLKALQILERKDNINDLDVETEPWLYNPSKSNIFAMKFFVASISNV